MRRKLVKQGAATLMISLPSKWAKREGLDKGDEIVLEESGKDLIVRSGEVKKGESVEIDIDGYRPLVNRVLIASYIKGVDELTVRYTNAEDIKNFQKKILPQLLGFEIIKHGKEKIVLKDLAGAENKDVNQIIDRLFLILDSMAEELVEALRNKDDLEGVIEIDESVNRFVNFCLRVLNKKGYEKFESTSQVYAIVNSLENVGDLYKGIARASQDSKISSDEIKIIEESRDLLGKFKKIFKEFNKEEVVSFAKKSKTVRKNMQSKIKKAGLLEFYLYDLNETIFKMNDYLLVSNV